MQNTLNRELSCPFVSIIVPVFNDFEPLKTCLAALESQTYPRHLYEVIVVDNGSNGNIADVVSQFAQVLTACESFPSSYAARNKGLSLAKGEAIGFTDADCVPASNWIEKGVANLLHVFKCGLVAGKIELFCLNPSRPTAVELYEMSKSFPQKYYIENYKGGATANVWTFRSVINDVGTFDATLKSGGDIEWGQRVYAAGYNQVYADDVCVAHPARRSLGQLYTKMVRRAGGEFDKKRKEGYSVGGFIVDLTQELKPPLRSIVRIAFDPKLSGIQQKSQVISVMLLAKYFKAFEKVRLQLGGISQRR